MRVLLLNVGRVAPKTLSDAPAVDKALTTNDSRRLPVCQYVEEGCLSRPRGPHQGSQRAGLDVAVYVVEKLSFATGNIDGVARE